MNGHLDSNEFYFPEHHHAAGENNIYTNHSIEKPTSSPYLYTVTTVGNQNVFMFGTDLSLSRINYNNPLITSFFYDLNGYFGGGAVGYVGFLGRTIHQSFSFGRFRMESINPAQLSQPLNIVDQDPSGKSQTYPAINYSKLNQYYQNAIETECDITIYGGTQLTYLQLASLVDPEIAPTFVKWFFWAADVASLTRALESKPLIKELSKPKTYLAQLMKLRATMEKTIGKY